MVYTRQPLLQREVAIIRNLKKKLKLSVAEIGQAVGRARKTVYEALDHKWKYKPRGRPQALTKKDVRGYVRLLNAMVKKANGKTEITLSLLHRRAKCKATLKCLMQHLHKEGVRCHPLRTKCILTKQDVEARYKFAKKYRKKPASWW